MERKLATVRKIRKIEPIEGADRIELCFVDGWQSVIKKGEYKEGDLVIFIEIDSILPLRKWSEFLQDKNHPEKPIRVKTCKLRGTLSQGIIIPLDTIKEELILVEGMDVTDLLEITKYEPPIPTELQGVKLADFPTHLFPKTDCERIQNLWGPEFLAKITGKQFAARIKEDGTSFSAYYKDGHCGICSRNVELDPSCITNLYVKMFNFYNLELLFKTLDLNIAIQAEIVGPSIQKNRARYAIQTIRVFDVFDIDKQRYYDYKELEEFCFKHNLPSVITDSLITFHGDEEMEDLLKFTQRTHPETVTDEPIEGLVFTTCEGERIRFKYINPDYLLGEE